MASTPFDGQPNVGFFFYNIRAYNYFLRKMQCPQCDLIPTSVII